MIEPLISSSELGEILGFAAGTIVDWAEAGEIPCFKMGGRLRFRESEVLAWIETKRGPGRGGDVSPAPTTRPTLGVLSQPSPAPHGGGSLAS